MHPLSSTARCRVHAPPDIEWKEGYKVNYNGCCKQDGKHWLCVHTSVPHSGVGIFPAEVPSSPENQGWSASAMKDGYQGQAHHGWGDATKADVRNTTWLRLVSEVCWCGLAAMANFVAVLFLYSTRSLMAWGVPNTRLLSSISPYQLPFWIPIPSKCRSKLSQSFISQHGWSNGQYNDNLGNQHYFCPDNTI